MRSEELLQSIDTCCMLEHDHRSSDSRSRVRLGLNRCPVKVDVHLPSHLARYRPHCTVLCC